MSRTKAVSDKALLVLTQRRWWAPLHEGWLPSLLGSCCASHTGHLEQACLCVVCHASASQRKLVRKFALLELAASRLEEACGGLSRVEIQVCMLRMYLLEASNSRHGESSVVLGSP